MSTPDLDPIAGRLQAVRDLLQRISDEAGSKTVRGADAVIERHRAEVYAAMEALGLAGYEFLQSQPSSEQIAAAQALVTSGLREVSLTSPVSAYGDRGKPRRMTYFEVVEHVREGTISGADISSRALDDYYIHTRIGQAFFHRLQLFNRRLIDEVAACQSRGVRLLHLISLQYVGGHELLPLARAAARPTMRVTCLDMTAAAVRHAQHTLRPAFNQQLEVIMAEPEKWLNEPSTPRDSACIIYAIQLLEQLQPKRCVRLLNGAYRVLRPGGVLLLGSTTGTVPLGERMIRDWLLGWDWQYRSEGDWRELFSQTPFGEESIRFEYEPLGVNALIRAEK